MAPPNAFEAAFGEHCSAVDDGQRNALFRANDGGETLNSADDVRSSDEYSHDSTFQVSGGNDNDTNDGARASVARTRLHNDAAGSRDDGDDESDNASESVPSAPSASAVVANAEPHSCLICWDEQPYIANVAKRTAMDQRISDFRNVMYRFYYMLRGQHRSDTVLRGLLEIRRLRIERFIEEYSSKRFTRWTMSMLRDHFYPPDGKRHRYDGVLEFDDELDQLKLVRTWIMQHGMFVTHPQTGQRVFNLKAVDPRVRLSKTIVDLVVRKNTEIARRAESGRAEIDTIVHALVSHTTTASHAHKRRRIDDDQSVSSMYDVGGM